MTWHEIQREYKLIVRRKSFGLTILQMREHAVRVRVFVQSVDDQAWTYAPKACTCAQENKKANRIEFWITFPF